MTYSWRFGNLPLLALSLLLSQSPLDAAWAEAAGTSLKASRANCNRAQFKAVVDVGHTDQAPGATSARGVPEYEYNLRLANRIGQRLTAAGFVETRCWSPRATLEGLTKRVGRANNMAADCSLDPSRSVPDNSWKPGSTRARRALLRSVQGPFDLRLHENAHPSQPVLRPAPRRPAQGARLAIRPHYTQAFMG